MSDHDEQHDGAGDVGTRVTEVTHLRAGDQQEANALWHAPLRRVLASELTRSTAQTPGMDRREAISGKTVGSEKLWMGETHVGPSTNSGDHHHGEAETAIYVVSGNPRFVFADGREEVVLETGPGDYVFVPPFTPHREENPSPDTPAVVVIARSTQEGIVVNLPSLWAPVVPAGGPAR
jgi:uncharacterized RmlC-like cupin family protein